jgi:putative membrane protein
MEPSATEHIKRDLEVKEKANIEIRDNLAIERTQFANERTFLAYIRTAMGLVLAGFSLMPFFHDKVFVWVGVVFIPAGIFVSIIGLKKFLVKRQHIMHRRASYTPTSPIHANLAAEEKLRKSDFPEN